ncbi:MAG: hypothetical protein KC733_11870, partial [Candidatus Omnitrophica bacterium]|nr:hypothetical protein [Candidatus Omnitrophota bacterium]
VDLFTFRKVSGEWRTKVAINLKNDTFEYQNKYSYLVGLDDTTIPFTGHFNGDSVIDLGTFDKDSGKWTFRMGTGGGNWPFNDLADINNFGTGKNIIIADFNTDGITDIGYYDPAIGKVYCRVGNGSGFTDDHALPFTFTLSDTNTQVAASDYNGDGMADWIAYTEVGDIEMVYSNLKIPDLLTTVSNGIGGVSTIEYQPSTQFSNTFLPFVVPVVKSVTVSDSRGSSYQTLYEYADGLWDSSDREFRGFGMVKTLDLDGNYSETTFHQDSLLAGRPIEQKSYDSNGTLFAKSFNTWDSDPISSGIDFVFLKRKDNYVYDGQTTPKQTAEEFFYDETPQLGNLTKVIQLGDVSVTGDERTVETFYVNNTTDNLLGLPRQTIVKDENGDIVRQTWFYYDNNPGNSDTPIKGLLTKKEDWNENNPKPTTSYTYDNFGNLKTTTDPRSQTTIITYESDVNIFPISTENALTHEVVNEYYGVNGVAQDSGDVFHGLWGQLKSTTDPNNKQGQRVYDEFGRLIKTISPKDSLAYPTSEVEFDYFTNYIQTTSKQRVNHDPGSTIDSVTFTDGLGRVIQTKAKSGKAGKFIVNGHTEYDYRGFAVKQYLPF